MLNALQIEPRTSADTNRAEKLLEVRGVTYKAAGRTLIDNIDLSLRPGAPTLILGPNGAGKSLLLRLMHGLLTPHSGEILWRGGANSLETRRRQAMVFQDPVMLRRSAKSNIVHALKLRGVPRAERGARAAQALEASGLAHLAGSPARRMSGGEQQRVALGRALIRRPNILLLDEPTSALDVSVQAEILNLLTDLRQEHQLTYLMVSHNLAVVGHICADIAVMQLGEIVEILNVEDMRAFRTRHPVYPAFAAKQPWVSGQLAHPVVE